MKTGADISIQLGMYCNRYTDEHSAENFMQINCEEKWGTGVTLEPVRQRDIILTYTLQPTDLLADTNKELFKHNGMKISTDESKVTVTGKAEIYMNKTQFAQVSI